MPYGYPTTPQDIGRVLVQYQQPTFRVPQAQQQQPSAYGQFSKALSSAMGTDQQGERRGQTIIPDVGGGTYGNAVAQAAAQSAVNRYGPVIMDPSNPYAGSQWDPNYGR